MITGFNTDVEHNGVIYHVQTEDKGLDTPLILSLVYDRGTILASKRSPYNDLLLGAFDEKELAERLNRQHKLICAAIKAGRIDDLKRMTSKKPERSNAPVEEKPLESKSKLEPQGKAEQIQPIATLEIEPQEDELVEITPTPKVLEEKPQYLEPIKKPNIELPKLNGQGTNNELTDTPIEISDVDLIFDDAENIDDTKNLKDVTLIPDEAVEVVTDFFEDEKTAEDTLRVELINEVEFRSGESKTVNILASRGSSENFLPGASIMIKVLGSNFRPLIFHTKTDSSGVAIINLQVPQFSRGRAAILIKAISNGDEAEIRRVIQPV